MRVILVLTLMTIVFLGAGAQASPEAALSKAVVSKHAKRIGAVLPKGWSVSMKGSMVTAQRDKEVRGEQLEVNAPAMRKPKIVTWTFRILLRFAPPMTAKQYHRMREENKATEAKLAAMREKMRHITHKFGSYIGLTQADKKLVADYNKIRARLHRLPDAFASDAVVYFEGGYSSSPFTTITDPKVRTECSAVRNKVRGLFISPPPETQPATSSVPAALNFTVKNIDDKDVALKTYQGKILLVVNVASRCGYTKQYAGLQALQEKYGGKGLVVMGFPANNFGGQEPGNNAEIKTFCTSKFKVTFPMFAKVSVKGSDQCDFYKYLTDGKKVKASQGQVRWNFEKFLIDRNGRVVKHYRSKIAPQAIAEDIEVLLKATPAQEKRSTSNENR
jgi:glutathione peroxidase